MFLSADIPAGIRFPFPTDREQNLDLELSLTCTIKASTNFRLEERCKMMNVRVVVTEYGGPETLKIVEEPLHRLQRACGTVPYSSARTKKLEKYARYVIMRAI